MRTVLAFAPFLLIQLVCGSALPDDARTLFHRMQDALGGAANIAAVHDLEEAVHDLEEVVRAEAWDGVTGRSMGHVLKRTRWVRPDYLRIDQSGPGSTYVLYFDGAAGWEIRPGSGRAEIITGGERAFARKYVRTFPLNVWLADRNPLYRITSPAPNVVRISDGEIADQLDIALDRASSLPSTITSISLSDPAHPIPSEPVINEWDTVQGVRFVRRWTAVRSGVRVAEALNVRHAVNVGLRPADLAVQPADLKPVLSR